MNYKIIENFIDDSLCSRLINDADIFSRNDHIQVLNNRLLLPSSSLSFLNLLDKSQPWQKLHDQLNSQNFLNMLLESLNLKKQNFLITDFFFDYEPSKMHRKYKDLNSKTKSPNGYKREIHRDSDSRTIVFLIYLNDLNINGSGGDLELHKYLKNDESIPAQPNEDECKLIETISPKKGRLVVFLNSHDSLHSVSEMKNHTGYRHFLYGSFTLLGKKNNFLSKSINKLKTNFNIFE